MRYEVKKLNDTEYEFTHIETREGLDGKDVEVIKGRSTLTEEKIVKGIKDLEDALDGQRKLTQKEHIKEISKCYLNDRQAEVEINERNKEALETMLSKLLEVK